jgi:DNA-binding response OmpR family regulator
MEKLKTPMTMKKNVLALLLDVTPLTKATLSRAFEPPDFEVAWTSNVNDALKALARHRFDLLLLDLNQPLRTAWGIFERLITLSRAPVVLLTEHKSHYEDAIANRGGVVLQKPFSADVLRHNVYDLLDLPSAAIAPAAPRKPELSEAEAAASPDDFREMLVQRYQAPYTPPPPAIPAAHRYWGLNE